MSVTAQHAECGARSGRRACARASSTPSSSERAVKYDLQDLTSRLQLCNRSHVVAYALRAGYI